MEERTRQTLCQICGYDIEDLLCADKPYIQDKHGKCGIEVVQDIVIERVISKSRNPLQCKEHRIHTAIDTAGYVPREYLERVITYIPGCNDGEMEKIAKFLSQRIIYKTWHYHSLKKLHGSLCQFPQS